MIHDSLMDFLEDGEEFGYVFTSAGWTCYDTKTWSDTYKQQVAIPQEVLPMKVNLFK